jgi:hypothetical protein
MALSQTVSRPTVYKSVLVTRIALQRGLDTFLATKRLGTLDHRSGEEEV